MYLRGVLAAAAAFVACAPAQAVTLTFDFGAVDFIQQSDMAKFYRTLGYDVATDINGGIANSMASGTFVQIGTHQPNTFQVLHSFDVRGTGELRLKNIDICCLPADSYPVVTFALTDGWQTIDFDPVLKGFAFQLSADTSFDVDNVVFGLETTPPPSALPEPGTWALMLIGFGFVGATVRSGSRSKARLT